MERSYLHIITAKGNKMLGLLKRTCPLLTNTTVKRTLYLTLVRSQISYASEVWSPHTNKLISKLCSFVSFVDNGRTRLSQNPVPTIKTPYCKSITFQASYFNRIVKLCLPVSLLDIPVKNRGNYANRHNLIQIPMQTNININSRPSFTRSQTNVLHELKIAHVSIRSLRNTSHLIETKELVKSHNIDVLTMSETWLNSTVTNGEIAIDDYKIFRQNRLHKKGGGVCAFVKKVLKLTIINELTNTSESNFQQLWIKLRNKK